VVTKTNLAFFCSAVICLSGWNASADAAPKKPKEPVVTAGALAPVDATQAAIAAVKPALVRILVAEVNCVQGREQKQESSGSGVIISPDGLVVTNHHVAGQAKRLLCTLSDKTMVEADLVGTDPLTDISVIRLRPRETPYPFAKWGDSTTVKVGDTVYAMGSPLSLSQSVTLGIVSNAEMVMPEFGGGGIEMNGEDVGSLVRWIGHDAAITHGNSGGPLVNKTGEVIGINEISFGLGGAIPAAVARPVAEEIIRTGKVQRAYVGISVQPLLKGSGITSGVLVGSSAPGSPARKAGIQSADIITQVNGKPVSVRFMEEMPIFNQTIATLPVGQPATIALLRNGQEVTVSVTPVVRPEAEPKAHESKPWGICVSDLSEFDALYRKAGGTDGVYVQSVRQGGPAGTAKPALAADDIILTVNGKPVKNAAEFNAVTDALVKDATEPVPTLVTVERGTEEIATVIEVGLKDLEDPSLEARKAHLAISTQVLTEDLAVGLGKPGQKGFRVTRVQEGSTAEKAGLKIGDLITALDGEELPASQPEDADLLAEILRQYKVGEEVTLTLIRDGKPFDQAFTLELAPVSVREMKRYRDDTFEFTARDLSEDDRVDDPTMKDVTGVFVESIESGGWAALGKLDVADVILNVDGKPTPSVDELRRVMRDITAARPQRVVMMVARGVDKAFVELETDWSDSAAGMKKGGPE